MKINKVEKITGLSKKAIRLYETKGLINISRDKNGYRNYSREDVELLNQIKLLRVAGIAITDIRMLFNGVLTLDEVIEKRKNEIEHDNGRNSEQYRFCEELNKQSVSVEQARNYVFNELEEGVAPSGALAVGIDIGTTTISAVVLDISRKVQIDVYSIPHCSSVPSDRFSPQSVSKIINKALSMLRHITESYHNIVSIGLTGQMHGIVYINGNGDPVSELINWQDKRADILLATGRSTCEEIENITGERISTGYGIATHYYNMLHLLVPDGAVGFCSIMDLLGMRLCGKTNPLLHTSVAASFGLFDIKSGCFMTEKLSLLGIDCSLLPTVTEESRILGYWNDIPISVAIGDNQASFLGAVKECGDSILVNIGTGSQISAVSDAFGMDIREDSGLEIRPLIEGKYLVCGSVLGGGASYALIEKFFRDYAVSSGMKDEPQYTVMNALALRAYNEGERTLNVDTNFYGTRLQPTRRGAINEIDGRNFTPSALILGTLKGMCAELYKIWQGFTGIKTNIIASGGAIQKNEVLTNVLRDTFELPVTVSAVREEAATGAALFSALSIGRIAYDSRFNDCAK